MVYALGSKLQTPARPKFTSADLNILECMPASKRCTGQVCPRQPIRSSISRVGMRPWPKSPTAGGAHAPPLGIRRCALTDGQSIGGPRVLGGGCMELYVHTIWILKHHDEHPRVGLQYVECLTDRCCSTTTPRRCGQNLRLVARTGLRDSCVLL
jgi:hypothetical protein